MKKLIRFIEDSFLQGDWLDGQFHEKEFTLTGTELTELSRLVKEAGKENKGISQKTARELLEAAKEMRELLEVIRTGPGLAIHGAHWKKWEAAIAKAEKEAKP